MFIDFCSIYKCCYRVYNTCMWRRLKLMLQMLYKMSPYQVYLNKKDGRKSFAFKMKLFEMPWRLTKIMRVSALRHHECHLYKTHSIQITCQCVTKCTTIRCSGSNATAYLYVRRALINSMGSTLIKKFGKYNSEATDIMSGK